MTHWSETEARIRGHSPFLARALDRFPLVVELLAAGDIEAALEMAQAAGGKPH